MSADFDILINSVRTRLPSAIDAVVRLELQNVLKDFLSESSMLVDNITINVVSGTTDYAVTSINGVVNRLMALVDVNNTPVNCTLIPPTISAPDFTIRLASTPSSAATYTAYVALTPDPSSRPEDSVPDWVIAKYRSGLEDGLLSRMMLQQAKPYSNPKLGEFHGRKFRYAITLAKNEALHAYKFRGQGWAYPRNFFLGRRSARM